MKPDEIRQLLGGYASGTLSEAEKTALFSAALEDQVLFDAMADEQALKDLLDDPESRGYLQAVLDEPAADSVLRPNVTGGVQSMSMPAPAPPAARARAADVIPMPVQAGSKRRRPPQMWWGLLAAAALSAVSIVGILKLNQPVKTVEMAKNTEPAPASAAAGKPAPVPANPASQPEPKPKPAGPPAKDIPEKAIKEADKSASGAAPRREASLDSKQVNEAPKTATAPEPAAAKPAEPTPEQAPKKEAEVRAPAPAPPPPTVQSQQPIVQSNQVQTAQATESSSPPVAQLGGARQMYFGGETQLRDQALKDQLARDQLAQAQSSPEESASGRGRAEKKRKAASAASGGLAGVAPSRSAAPALAKSAPATVTTRTPFAMRYRILRRGSGTDFVPVAPDTRFRIGEEIVVQIEKNSGGTAEIARAGVGPLPMSIQTNAIARSVPLTVTGPLELTVTLTRSGAAFNGPQGTLAQPAASQQSEVADGMVYIAEPAAASRKPLVVRIAIAVGQ